MAEGPEVLWQQAGAAVRVGWGGESDESDEEDTEESGKSSGVWTSWRLKRARCPTCTAEAWENDNGVFVARRLCV